MKRILYVLVMLFLFSSCESEFENVFDKTPTERKIESNLKLSNLLSDAEFGWKTKLIVGTSPTVGEYLVFKFNKLEAGINSGIVTIASSFGKEDSEYIISSEIGSLLRFVTPNESLYWMIYPSDRTPQGYGADMEYIFMKEEGDKLYFKGKERNSEMVLEKANESDWDMTVVEDLREKFLATKTKHFSFLSITDGIEGTSNENPLYIQIEAAPYATYFEESLKQLFYDFKYVYKGVRTRTNAATYLYSHDGVDFTDPLIIGDAKVSNIKYDKASNVWSIGDEGVTGTLIASDLPLVVVDGIVDLFIDKFFADDMGMLIDPWGSFGTFKNIVTDNFYNTALPKLKRMRIVSKYVSPETGEMLGSGILILQYEDTDFTFIPLKMNKLGVNTIGFERNGDVVTNVVGSAERVANDEKLNKVFSMICDEKGWMINCDVISYGLYDYYDCMFYSVSDPNSMIEHMGKILQ